MAIAGNVMVAAIRMSSPESPLTLAHWRRSVAELYADARAIARQDPADATARFRAARDRLFVEHPDSPIGAAERPRWSGAWYGYDPAWRVVGMVSVARSVSTIEIPLAADGVLRCSRFATVHFDVAGNSGRLALYWLEGYGGGLWLPFADATNGTGTYGGGRYLYDTIKGADLGGTADAFVLDFNFAYNPSCAYDERWSCPLSPPENRLPFAITAGERLPPKPTDV
jgi:uncharacterized protein (DUF1684 family)